MSKLQQAMVSYRMNGVIYCTMIVAESWEDAEARLQAIKMSGRIEGWPCYTMSANALTLPFVALWVHLITWWKNFIGAKE